ncbi:invasion associated locus B family protein [Brucellaceae bacterium C25G]
MRLIYKAVEIAAVIILMTAGVANAQENGKPVSLRETYGDWVVGCDYSGDQYYCMMSQQQRKKETGQLILAAELQQNADGVTDGKLVLPFGLKLPDGAELSVDEHESWGMIFFATCLPVGCVLSPDLSAERLTSLRNGKQLGVNVTAQENGQKLALAVSLNGFAQAHDRLKSLSVQSGKK